MSERQGNPPGEVPPPSAMGRTPWGFLGMLVVLLGVEWTLGQHDLDFTAPWHWDWRTTGKLTSRKQGKADILLFGDSLMKFGVMPKVIQDRTGKSAYNFALHTGQTSSSYFMLRRVLDAGNQPKGVVLELTPHMFAHQAEENARLWPEMLNPRECLDLAWTMREPEFFAATMLGRVMPSIKERHDIRAFVHAALVGGPNPSRRAEIPTFRRNWKVNDGAQLMPDGTAPAIDPVHWEVSLYKAWRPNPVNVAYLDRFLALTREHQIPVVWLLPPNQPSILARTEASGYDAAYTRFVRSVAARFPNVTVADARRSGFVPDEFNDGIHLKRNGALRLSAALGDLLRIGPPAGTWVDLDAGKPRPIDLPIEDLGQSAVALQNDQHKSRR